MNKKLSSLQTIVVLIALLGVAGFLAWRYFSAPAFPGEDPRDKALYNTAVTEIALTFGELAPNRLSPDAAPRRSAGGGGGGAVTPKGEAAKKEADRYAREVTPKYNALAEGMRQAGIPVAYDDVEKKAAAGRVPVTVLLTLEGNGTVVEGQPESGVLGYKAELKRDVYTSTSATNPIKVTVATITGSVGVTSAATLQTKQDEAVKAALRGIIARWQEDNPKPAGK